MNVWITLVAASTLTLALRAGPSLLGGGLAAPASLRRATRFAVPALMGALASRSVVAHAATGGVPVVVAVAVAAVVGVRSRSTTATIAAGVVAHLVAAAMID